MCERIELTTTVIKLWKISNGLRSGKSAIYYLQLYGTTIIYNSTGTTIIWQEIHDLNNKNRKYMTKSSVLLEHKWSKKRKIKIHYEREMKENQWNNAIKQT